MYFLSPLGSEGTFIWWTVAEPGLAPWDGSKIAQKTSTWNFRREVDSWPLWSHWSWSWLDLGVSGHHVVRMGLIGLTWVNLGPFHTAAGFWPMSQLHSLLAPCNAAPQAGWVKCEAVEGLGWDFYYNRFSYLGSCAEHPITRCCGRTCGYYFVFHLTAPVASRTFTTATSWMATTRLNVGTS